MAFSKFVKFIHRLIFFIVIFTELDRKVKKVSSNMDEKVPFFNLAIHFKAFAEIRNKCFDKEEV